MLKLQNTLHKPYRIFHTGENPLLVQCEDFETWVCKHGRLGTINLFNELIASRFANIWEIKTPEICLINVLEDHLPLDLGGNLQPSYFKKPCFGSKYISSSKEIDSTLIHSFQNKYFKSKIQNKDDFLKIALFDIWLSNEDRNHNNSNLLLDFTSNDMYYFYAFDHNAIFNTNLMLKYGITQLTDDESIINTELAKLLFKKGEKLKTTVDNLVTKMYLCTDQCKTNLKMILAEVPLAWNVDCVEIESLLIKNIFADDWINECENNFRTLIQTYI